MLLTIGSFVLPLLSGLAMYWVGHGRARLGWYTLMLAQVPWVVYDVCTGQYGFLLTSGISLAAAMSGLQALDHSGR